MADALKLNEQLPIIPIRDGVVFPGTEVVLTFGRQRSVAAIEAANSFNRHVVLVMQKTPNNNNPKPTDLFEIGTKAVIERMFKNEGEINALVRGISRVRIDAYGSTEPYFLGNVSEIPDILEHEDQVKALCNHLLTELRKAVNIGKSIDFLIFMNIMSSPPAGDLANQIANILEIKPYEKQGLLEMSKVQERLERVNTLLSNEVKVLELERKISSKTQERFDKNIRESVLRERLKTIEQELGQEEDKEFALLAKKIAEAKMPTDVEEKASKELKRLSQMSSYNPEASYLRTYLDWLIELPWSKASKTAVDIAAAEKILDTDHYGLKKVKERILEYLAVMKLKTDRVQADREKAEKEPDKKSETEPVAKRASLPTILCFVGPPGVGKTSLGKSIAKALGRKFVKISLGGVRDEAEIRGHRRTYVGALPGRIIQAVKQAGTNNPVFMMDEVDKIGADFRGDPSAALLEALDPEQNYAFSDHYLEVPFDLSHVFFITTCNVLDTIPPALRDRLPVIRFAGYTEDEKFHIGRDFLVEKQRGNHAVPKGSMKITDQALRDIIRKYTREAGVRNLEREIATLFRKVAKKIAEGNGKTKKTFSIGSNNLHGYLGPYKFTSYLAEKKDEVGMVTGLAWTEAGGDILFIVVALMPGRGNLTFTGQLGDVMKESC